MSNTSKPFAKPLSAAVGHAMTYLESLQHRPVGARADVVTLRSRLDRALSDSGLPAEQVINELAADVEEGLHAAGGGRFFAWVIGGALPAALAAEWLTCAWDQNPHCFATSPAAAVVEEIVGRWLKELLGLPPRASFAVVTGCQMAHITCLAAARHAVLARKGWDVERQGLAGAPPIRVISSAHAHGSIDRALRLLGMGTSCWTRLSVDQRGQLPPDALAAALAAEPGIATILVLQAGDVNTGTFDDFEQLIPIARRHDAWVHVDGAFGLWAATSAKLRHLLAGVTAADSWATDGHKWLNVPFDCGYAFVNEPDAHAGALGLRVSYISYASDARDESDWNPEWSRRSRGFATYAALRELGRKGVSDLIERCCGHARAIVSGIGRLPGAEILWEPQLNQGLLRFRSRVQDATDDDHDRTTEAVIAKINASGEAFFSGTTWKGHRAMRVSVVNWQTNADDVARAVACVATVLKTI